MISKGAEQNNVFWNVVKLFFGMNPKNRYWLLFIFYLSKERLLQVIENYNSDKSEVLLRLNIHDITNDDIAEQWAKSGVYNKCIVANTTHNSYQIASDLIDLMNREENNVDGFSSNNVFLSHRWEPTYLFGIAESLMSLSDEWYNDNSSYAFDIITHKIKSTNNISARMFLQPKEITKLATKLLGADAGIVYNPYEDVCSYATELNDSCEYYGHVISYSAYIMGKFNLLINKKYNAKLEMFFSSSKDRSCVYDYIISTPPWGLRLPNSEITTAEADVLNLAMLNTRRKSVGIYSASSCANVSSVHRNIFRDLIDSDIIETVILLPHSTMTFTTIAPIIIVTNKDKRNRGVIRFVDSSEMYISSGRNNVLNLVDNYYDIIHAINIEDSVKWAKDVTLDEVKQNRYSLYPKTYFWAQTNDLPSGYKRVDFCEIAESYQGTRIFNETTGHLAKISKLATVASDCERKVEDFEISDHLSNVLKIEEPVILIAQTNDARPTYCKASKSDPLFLPPNIKAYKIIKDWVSPYYLCFELSRRFLKGGNGVVLVNSRERLMHTALAFPSTNKEEQNNIVAEARLQYKFEKARELGLQEVMDKMKAEYINEIRLRKHDMRPYLRNLRSIERLIRHYVSSVDVDLAFSNKIVKLLDMWKDSLEHLSNLIDTFSDEEQFGSPELMDINQYFNQLISNHSAENFGYEMHYECDKGALEEFGLIKPDTSNKEMEVLNEVGAFKHKPTDHNTPLYVNVAHVDFDRLVRNIIQNAQQHGFTNGQRNDYRIEINLSIDIQKGMYQIDFINNGTPLPLGVDKLRYGLRGEKAGITGGTGKGGYVVKSIVEHYKGDYDVFMDDMGTVIRIMLPITDRGDE